MNRKKLKCHHLQKCKFLFTEFLYASKIEWATEQLPTIPASTEYVLRVFIDSVAVNQKTFERIQNTSEDSEYVQLVETVFNLTNTWLCNSLIRIFIIKLNSVLPLLFLLLFPFLHNQSCLVFRLTLSY